MSVSSEHADFVGSGGVSGVSEDGSPTALRDTFPTPEQIEAELARVKRKGRFRRSLAATLGVLAVVAAAAVLVATLFVPVLRIYGNSMTPTLEDGDVVVAVDCGDFETGDVIAFHHGSKVLVKRVIATSGDWVDIDVDGVVSVNGVELDEPYVSDASLGNCDIKLPYQVPDSRVFVMGDHRSVSVDSRSSAVGCIADDQVIGKLVLRVWPLEGFGALQGTLWLG